MQLKVEDFIKPCKCGKTHELFVQKIIIKEDAAGQIDSFLQDQEINRYPVIICDENTYLAAGKNIYELLTSNSKEIITLAKEGLRADEHGVEGIRGKWYANTSVLIAVGAGTIHDIVRYVAHEYNVPFISVPTAASVDGFVSTVAAMTLGGFKVTSPAVSPIAVFADTNVFSKAPYRLTASGVADLLGKYTALLDWQFSHALINEYICEKVVEMEKEAVEKVVQSIDQIQLNDKNAYENLMYGLLLSGLAMQMIGNSRPASGSEHHMSHLWEMHVINEEVDALHGEKVGVALGLVCDEYKKLLNIENIKNHIKPYQGLPREMLKENFKDLYISIVEENTPDLLEAIDINVLEEKFDEIKELINKLPSGDDIRKILKRAGAKTTLEEIGLADSVLEKSIILSPFVRRRLTLMRMLHLIK